MDDAHPQRPTDIIRARLTALLDQGERCATLGRWRESEAILREVWTHAVQDEPDLARLAAWRLGWLLMGLQTYAEAMTWLRRVGSARPRDLPAWLDVPGVMVEMCQVMAEGTAPSAPAAPSRKAAPRLPALAVLSLGCFQIAREGRTLPACPARKALALFRYLLTRPRQSAHKEELMDRLWADASPAEATNRLHVAVSTLRRYLDPPGESYLVWEDGGYVLNPDARIENDCLAFQRISADAEQWWRGGDAERAERAYLQALDLYHGDYWVDARDLDWAMAIQEKLLARYILALDHLGQIYVGQRRLEEAVACYRRLLERDAYREDAHAQIMRCYWRLDRRGDALQQYGYCVRILASDLGIKPVRELQELCSEIAHGAPPQP